jgi:hypothetical protein
MNRIVRLAAPAVVSLGLFASSASAQEAPKPLPPPPPPPVSAQAPNGEYVAPLSQQTQQTYVPQSVALNGPRTISDWSEGEPIPPGYHAAQRAQRGLIIGGSVMFGVMYLLSVVVAAAVSDANKASGGTTNDDALYIPGIGPFMLMPGNSSSLGNVVLAIDGAVQTGGIIMFIYGITSPKTVLVRNDLGSQKPLILPMRVGSDGYGMGLVAHF